MRKLIIAAGALMAVSFASLGTVQASVDARALKSVDWSHSGPFGTFDRSAAQRGFQVYKDVCAGCHSMRLLSYRNLMDLGFSEEQVKAIAADYEVEDGPNDDGEMFDRAGMPADRFVSPFPNEKAARASNNGAFPPDFSLIVKARAGHENYIYSILTGYEDAPEGIDLAEGMNYNPYFSGTQIAMSPPLFDEAVEYLDGTNPTVEQMAQDVTVFLAWAAEPKMEARKSMGLKVMIYLVILTGLLYAVKRKVWANVH